MLGPRWLLARQGDPLVVGGFMPHDSRLRLRNLNHVHADAINTELAFPKLPANRTRCRHGGTDENDPEPTSDRSRKRVASRHRITAGLRSLKTETGGSSCEFDFCLCSPPQSSWSRRVLPPDQKRMSLRRR